MHAPYQRTVRAHAKVNLLLRILAREASGFHGIETVFQRLALHDVVHVSVREAHRTLECGGPTMPAGGLGAMEDNLAWRAAAAYAEASGWETGWHMTIEKHIPVGGGLGGGSADAAAVLRALESMSPSPIGAAALLALAGTLGSDVPFFVLDCSLALGWNRGDRLLQLPALPTADVTLLTFPQGVNTGAAYGAMAQARASTRTHARTYASDAFATWGNVARLAQNDFEVVVPALHAGVSALLPTVQRSATTLRDDGTAAIGMLSGSGATLFLLSDTPGEPSVPLARGRPVAELLPPPLDGAALLDHGVRVVVTHTA
jgi:4-diphosphocytidyl-2-C-methyl-D-erythritol kinase